LVLSSFARARRTIEGGIVSICAKLLCGLAAAILLVLPACAQPQAAPPKAFQFALQNGMQVVVLSDHAKPVVTQLLCFKVGAADDPPGLSGLARLLQHLMFRGTHAMPGNAFSDTVARYGGEAGAFTAYDDTVYFEQIGKERLRLVMHLEADRMTGLDLTDKSVAAEVQAALAERRTRVDGDPVAVTSEQAEAALHLSHPYGRPLSGWSDELRHVDRPALADFYQRHYAPNNAILIVAGDVTADEARDAAEAEYGALGARELSERVEYAQPPRFGETRLAVERKDVKAPMFLRLYRVPSYAEAAPGQAEALEVFARLIGGDTSSALYRRLVVQKKLALGLAASYSGYFRDAGELRLVASPRPGVTLDALERAIDEMLAQALGRLPTKAELAHAKAQFVAATRKQNQIELAEAYARALAVGLTVFDVQQWPARIDAVSADDVRKAARAALLPKESVTAYLTPEETVSTEKKNQPSP
jgi:zinc protease